MTAAEATSDYVLVQGLRDTRGTFDRWRRHPWTILRPWLLGSLAIAVALLLAVWVIGALTPTDPSPYPFPGVDVPARWQNVGVVLVRNSLVLALHAFACVAGFIAGSSLPREAERHSGLWRRIHDHAGRLAILFVSAATLFSLSTQAYILGYMASTLAGHLHTSVGLLLLTLTPHALPELVALFLPLAAWLLASRRGDWHELLAATFVTVGIATPVLVAASLVEVFVTPHLILSLAQ